MIDYKNVYIEQITKLYDDYLSYFKYKKEKKSFLQRMQKLLEEIFVFDNQKYELELNRLSEIKASGKEDKLNVLTDIASLIKKHMDTINNYVTAYEKETGSPINVDFNISKLTTKLDEVESEIEILNTYIANENKISNLNKINEDTDIELAKIDDKKSHSISINEEMEFALNETIKKILEENNVESIDIEDTQTHFPLYQELYLKAEEQSSTDPSIANVLDMAKKNYLEYSKKKSLIELKPLAEEQLKEYQELSTKRNTINEIITKGLQENTFTELEDLLKEQNQKLEFQLKDLKKEELLLTVKKNNEEELKSLKEQNDKIEKQLSLNIKKEEETKEGSSELKEETNEIKEPETKNNDFKLVEIEEVEVIKNPYHNSNEKPKEDNIKTNIITKTEPAPSWLEYAIVENEHKFINWFDKLNALIKRKKYLKDE
ncbi:MAG: hypothetical protein ACI4VR_03605 [Bacilli bacterium]